jgi:hypothetical protein
MKTNGKHSLAWVATVSMGLGHEGLLKKIGEKPLPLLTSYMTPAIAADVARYEKIYCIICDAEVSRAWVSENPQTSRIHYLVPCERTVQRLKRYGVPEGHISFTGFPFPQELLGGEDFGTLKSDLARRLFNLDPSEIFRKKYEQQVTALLGKGRIQGEARGVVRISYAVGGAGAQKKIGAQIAKSLAHELLKGTVRLNLIDHKKNRYPLDKARRAFFLLRARSAPHPLAKPGIAGTVKQEMAFSHTLSASAGKLSFHKPLAFRASA